MRVAMIGASGLVGSLTVPLLARHELVLIGRRALPLDVPQRIGRIDEWPSFVDAPVDVAISTLGTTWRAVGKSEAAFRAIDHDAVVAFAAAARRAGARQAIVVSSVGASSGSRSFYLRTKGEMEDALDAVGFDALDILRPGLLRGVRSKERRLKERMAIAASALTDRLTPAAFDGYRSITAESVAAAIAALVGRTDCRRAVHGNREILREALSVV